MESVCGGGYSGVYCHLHLLKSVGCVLLLLGVVCELWEGEDSDQTECCIETLWVEDCNQSLDTVKY